MTGPHPDPAPLVQGHVVAVHVDVGDFKRLQNASCYRRAFTAMSRLEALYGGEVNADWDWSVIYWLGHDYAAVILARAFLASAGFGYEVLWDFGADGEAGSRGWVILTDYDLHGYAASWAPGAAPELSTGEPS